MEYAIIKAHIYHLEQAIQVNTFPASKTINGLVLITPWKMNGGNGVEQYIYNEQEKIIKQNTETTRHMDD